MTTPSRSTRAGRGRRMSAAATGCRGTSILAGTCNRKSVCRGSGTYIFRATDPDGGTPLRQLSTLTQRLEPFGDRVGPAIRILNLRASKVFSVGRTKLEFDLEGFNLLNSSAPLQVVYASGPTFGWFGAANSSSAGDTGIVTARVARLGINIASEHSQSGGCAVVLATVHWIVRKG